MYNSFEIQNEVSMTLKKKPVKWAGVITNIQSNVLEALARYKFLTYSQLLALNVGTTQYAYLQKQVKSLSDRRKPFAGSHHFRVPQPRKGKVESMHYLTKEGKKALVYDLQVPEENIKMPIGKTVAYRDYIHRKHTIDFQIALDMWAYTNDYEIPFFDCYFDMTGNNRVSRNLRANTRIDLSQDEYFIPDGAFKVVKQHGSENFFLFEMCNSKDTKYIIRQIQKHARSMHFHCTHKKYNLSESTSYKVILMFNFPSIMKAVIERVQKDPAFVYIKHLFLCKAIERDEDGKSIPFYKSDFDEWVNFEGEEVGLDQ